MTVIQEIFDLFDTWGREAYQWEHVSQREHALQAAALAEAEGAPSALVLAALLHDIGHLVARLRSTDPTNFEFGKHHQHLGGAWLSPSFGLDITEPVRLHVEAKRYLCAVEPHYRKQLCPASLRSLALQGGALSRSEIREFQENTYHREAVWLRRIDDRAKVAGLAVASIEHYRERLETALLKRYLELESERKGGDPSDVDVHTEKVRNWSTESNLMIAPWER